MLLYHFPLTSSSSSPNLVNKGLKQDYTITSSGFVAGGMISSFCLQGDVVDGHIHINNLNGGSICCRVKGDIVCIYALQGELRVIDDGKWHSYVLCDGKAYQDGAYLQDISAITMFDNCIDANGSLIQDIRIYDHPLSKAEINEYSRALVVHYPLQGNELNPSVLKDVSGFGNDATSWNFVKNGETPRGLQSIKLNGVDSYAIADNISVAQSVSFWVKPQQLTTSQIFYVDKSADMCFNLLSLNRGITIKLAANTYPEDSITYNEWNHIVIVKGSTNNDFFVNGNRITASNVSEILYDDGGKMRIGCRRRHDANSLFAKGFISDFRIYATALSSEDIKNLYNSPISVSKQHQTMAFGFVEGNDGFAANKNGIVQHNEIIEGSADGCYNDKLITNEIIEQ